MSPTEIPSPDPAGTDESVSPDAAAPSDRTAVAAAAALVLVGVIATIWGAVRWATSPSNRTDPLDPAYVEYCKGGAIPTNLTEGLWAPWLVMLASTVVLVIVAGSERKTPRWVTVATVLGMLTVAVTCPKITSMLYGIDCLRT